MILAAGSRKVRSATISLCVCARPGLRWPHGWPGTWRAEACGTVPVGVRRAPVGMRCARHTATLGVAIASSPQQLQCLRQCGYRAVSGRRGLLNVYNVDRHACRDSSGVERLTVDQEARVQFPFPVQGLCTSFPFRELKTLERSWP